MPFRSLEQGINLIQQGNHEEGARLVRIALKSEQIQGEMRATAFLWLAETVQSRDEKLSMYQQALNIDPENEYARQRIAQLYASDLPPSSPASNPPAAQSSQQQSPAPPAGMPGEMPGMNQQGFTPQQAPTAQPAQYQPHTTEANTAQTQHTVPQFYRTVGILNGPNGQGTGFFVTQEGLVATTRYIVGGMEALTIELEPGRHIKGQVVRSFPEIDLALVHTGVAVSQLFPAQAAETLVDNAQITAIAHPGRILSGQRRATRSEISSDWFPTTIGQMVDAGGNPVFDERNMLVGMLTKNANRTSPYVYGLNVNTIYRSVEHYVREVQSTGTNQIYCSGCGNLSRAGGAGGYYCETCGAVFPRFLDTTRQQMPQMQAYYADSRHRPCSNCGAREGYHNTLCLRCGYQN